MKELFLTIRNLCSTVAGIAWVDKDYKQIDIYDPAGAPAVPFPCILIRIIMPQIETVSGKNQICTGQVVIRIAANLATVETNAGASNAAVDRSLQYYDLADAAFNVLQNCTGGLIKSFDRISQADEERKDGMSVMRQVYNCSFLQSGS